MEKQTETAAVAALAREGAMQPQVIEIKRGDHDSAQVVLVPTAGGSYTMASIKGELDKYRDLPERRRGIARLHSLDSFIAHVMRNKDADTAIFADVASDTPSITAVYDYHLAGEGGDGKARHLGHQAVHTFPLSEEWGTWSALGNEPFSQGDFAVFLEEHVGDVLAPTSEAAKRGRLAEFAELHGKLATQQELLSLSKGLAVRVDVKVAQNVNLQNGSGKLVFEEEHKDASGNALVVPAGFAIAIPVFAPGAERDASGAARVQLDVIPVRLRYRVSGGRVSWTLAPHRLDLVLRDALSEAVARVRKETGVPVFEGAPEK